MYVNVSPAVPLVKSAPGVPCLSDSSDKSALLSEGGVYDSICGVP